MVEMVIRLEDESLLAPLKRLMKSLLGITSVEVRRNVAVAFAKKVRDAVYQEQLDRLAELASLKANWDDDGALPIENEVIQNVEQLIEQSDDNDLKKWVLFPDINGTILLESKSGDASISIGNKEFSFAGSHLQGNNKKLSTASLLSVMRQIIA